MIQQRQKIFFIIFLILIAIIPIQVSAGNNGSSTTTTGDLKIPSLNDENGEGSCKPGNAHDWKCKFSKEASRIDKLTDSSTKITKKWKATDIWNNVIEKSTAGLRFFASLIEEKEETYQCYQIITDNYTCTYYVNIYDTECGAYGEGGECIDWITTITQDDREKTCTHKRIEAGCNNAFLEAEKEKKLNSISINPSYEVRVPDPNDANCKGDQCITIIKNPKKSTSLVKYNKGKNFTIKATLLYGINKTCINAITGKVRYLNENEQCDNKTEYEFKSEKEYWSAFIPLNQKTNENFIIKMMPTKTSEYSGNYCKEIIKQNPESYFYSLVPLNNKEFTGNYNSDLSIAEKNGCKDYIKFDVGIVQKFYNEEQGSDNNLTFKGYYFSYKPIDINNPFPNVRSKNDLIKTTTSNGNKETTYSYWYDWYTNNNNAKTNLKVEDSFNKIEYEAIINNPKALRNDTISYDNWTEYMKIDGTSSFVDNNVTRISNPITYYKLGCGPLNSTEKIDGKTNPLYLKECKEMTTK